MSFFNGGGGSVAQILAAVGGGWGFYADSAVTVGTAQSVATHATDFTVIPVDAALFTSEELPSDTTDPLWDVASSSVAPYNFHDVLHVRVRMVAENYSGSSPFVELCIDAGGTSGKIECRSIPLLKGGVAQIVELTGALFVGADFLANGGQVQLRYDGNGSIDLYNKSVFIQRTFRKQN